MRASEIRFPYLPQDKVVPPFFFLLFVQVSKVCESVHEWRGDPTAHPSFPCLIFGAPTEENSVTLQFTS